MQDGLALWHHYDMQDRLPDKERFPEEQKKDSFCSSRKSGNPSSKSEYFLDEEGVLYKRRTDRKHHLVVPHSLIRDVIRANHDPVYVALPGMKRTFDFISLRYWWPSMRKSVEDYVRKSDPCQRRKEGKEFVAPLGEVEEPTAHFHFTTVDVTGPYLIIPRKNKYLLTFIDHFTKYVEAFPIPDQSAETCARVCATQIVTRHGTGSTLITDQGRSFKFSFFNKPAEY